MKTIFNLLFLVALQAHAQTEIQGVVADKQTGTGLAGVKLVVKNPRFIALTDLKGSYKLPLKAGKYDLQLSYIGYETKDTTIQLIENQRLTIHFALQLLEEAVSNGSFDTLPNFDPITYEQKFRIVATEPKTALRPSNRNAPIIRLPTSAAPQKTKVRSNPSEDDPFPDYSTMPTPKRSDTVPTKLNIEDGLPDYTDVSDYDASTESYAAWAENEYKNPQKEALSTFSIDADNASYTNVRRYVRQQRLPPKDAVRIEELVNYFQYDYPQPNQKHPFSVTTELSFCPWAKEHLLLRIGLQGKKMDLNQAPPNNLVFLVDVSGSMDAANKLPLVQHAFKLLANNLRPIDRVSIVTYAGAAGLALPPTDGSNKPLILETIDNLKAGGSTAGAEGIELAYQVAQQNFIKNGNNRILLATDGDFNVGVSSDSALQTLIETKLKSGIFLTCLGFGYGNLKDDKLEILANKGNGNYYYVDNQEEANRILSQMIGGTLYTIAKDVKLQVDFNTQLVDSYRLIGYENRLLRQQDFKNDAKDAGELGAGMSVTALYEVIPTRNAPRKTLATVHLRYKQPAGDNSILFSQKVDNQSIILQKTSIDFRFAAAVTGWGQLLRDSKFKGDLTFQQVADLALGAIGDDPEGYRIAFVQLVQQCLKLSAKK